MTSFPTWDDIYAQDKELNKELIRAQEAWNAIAKKMHNSGLSVTFEKSPCQPWLIIKAKGCRFTRLGFIPT